MNHGRVKFEKRRAGKFPTCASGLPLEATRSAPAEIECVEQITGMLAYSRQEAGIIATTSPVCIRETV